MGTMDIIRAALFTPTRNGWGIPTKVEGDPGIGKTAMTEQLAEKLGFDYQTLVLSTTEAVEAAGYPYIDEKKVVKDNKVVETKREMRYALPGYAKRAQTADRFLLILDELNTCDPRVFSAYMRVVNERMCGEAPLGDGTRIVACINPTEIAQAAGGVDLPMAFANRWCHLKAVKPPVSQWADWLVNQEFSEDSDVEDAAAIEAHVLKAWPEHFGRSAGEVVGYLHAMPTRHLVVPDPTSKDASGAWPAPRSWDLFTRARASSALHGLGAEDADQFQAGCIGAIAYSEFRKWVRDADLPDARAWLRGEVEFVHNAARLDRTAAFLAAAATMLTALPVGERGAEFKRLVGFMGTFETRRDILINSIALLHGSIKSTEMMDLPGDLRKVIVSLGQLRNESRGK